MGFDRFVVRLWVSLALHMYACYKCLQMYFAVTEPSWFCRYVKHFPTQTATSQQEFRTLYITVDLLCTPNKSMTSNQNWMWCAGRMLMFNPQYYVLLCSFEQFCHRMWYHMNSEWISLHCTVRSHSWIYIIMMSIVLQCVTASTTTSLLPLKFIRNVTGKAGAYLCISNPSG